MNSRSKRMLELVLGQENMQLFPAENLSGLGVTPNPTFVNVESEGKLISHAVLNN